MPEITLNLYWYWFIGFFAGWGMWDFVIKMKTLWKLWRDK